MIRISLFTMLTASVLAFAAGCATEQSVTKYKLQLGVPEGSREYKKINPAGLQLNLISTPVYYAGKSAVVTFALRNAGMKKINIEQWYRHEPDNLKLRIQPYLPGMTAPDPDGWFEIEDPRKRPVMHYPLTLMPDNQALISKKLDFVSMMEVTPGKERRFFLQACSTLSSLDLQSDIVVLKILPKQIKKEVKK